MLKASDWHLVDNANTSYDNDSSLVNMSLIYRH